MRLFYYERIFRPMNLPLICETDRFWKYEKKIGAIRKKYVMEDRQVRKWRAETRQRGDKDQIKSRVCSFRQRADTVATGQRLMDTIERFTPTYKAVLKNIGKVEISF